MGVILLCITTCRKMEWFCEEAASLAWPQLYFISGVIFLDLVCSESVSEAIFYYKALFGMVGYGLSNDYTAFYSHEYGFFLLLGCLCITPFFAWLQKRLAKQKYLSLVAVPGLLLIFFITISYLVKGAIILLSIFNSKG